MENLSVGFLYRTEGMRDGRRGWIMSRNLLKLQGRPKGQLARERPIETSSLSMSPSSPGLSRRIVQQAVGQIPATPQERR